MMGRAKASPQWVEDTVKTLHKIVFFLCVIGAVAMFLIMLLTVADVIGRSFFTRPIVGTYEISRYFLAVIVLLGIGYAQQTGQHVAVDYFVSMLPPRGQFAFENLATALGLVFFALVAWQGWKGGWHSLHANLVSDTISMPLYPFEFLIAVGALCMCIELFLKLVTGLTKD
ncbi:MAG: TRAP transporter small permease [Pseudomonadota bacterium]